jgi:putative tricarboxylic transport membrane protein
MKSRVGILFWLAFGVYVSIHAYYLGIGNLRHPGSGLVFFLCGLFVVILSVIDLGRSFLKQPEREDERESLWKGLRWKKIILVTGILAVYTFFLETLGFVLSAFLLMIVLFRAVEPIRWWITITSSLVCVSVSYVLFKTLLGVEFPAGFLGF